MKINAKQLLEGSNVEDITADTDDLVEVNLLANVMDKVTRSRERDLKARETSGELIRRSVLDDALNAIYATAETELGDKLWQHINDAGVDVNKAKAISLHFMNKMYDVVSLYGTVEHTPTE